MFFSGSHRSEETDKVDWTLFIVDADEGIINDFFFSFSVVSSATKENKSTGVDSKFGAQKLKQKKCDWLLILEIFSLFTDKNYLKISFKKMFEILEKN